MQQFCVESAPPPCKLHKKAPLPLSLSGGGAYFRVVSPCGNAVRHPPGRGIASILENVSMPTLSRRGARRAPRRISPGKFSEPGENPGHRRGDHRSPAKPQRQTSPLPRLLRRQTANVSSRGDVTPVGATIGHPQKQNDKCHPCPAGTSGAVHYSLASGSASRSMPRRFRASSRAFEDISGSPSRVSSARRLRAEPSPPRSPLS